MEITTKVSIWKITSEIRYQVNLALRSPLQNLFKKSYSQLAICESDTRYVLEGHN